MKKKIFIIALLLISQVSISQKGNFFIETELTSKFSFGEITRNDIEINSSLIVNVPENSKFRNPIYGVEISINYFFKKRLSIGVGTGLNIVKFELHPIFQNEYYDKIMIPAFLKFRYTKPLNSNWNIISDFNIGYQFSKNYFGYSDRGFGYIEKGGNLYSANIGVRKKINKYFFLFKIGYEFNQFNNLIDSDLTNNNSIKFKTNYNLLRLSMALNF